MSDLPPGLEDFGKRLEQAAARQDEELRATQPRPRRRWRKFGLPLLAAFAAAAASAGAVKLIDPGGDPIEPEPSAPKAPDDQTVVMATLTEDPGGGPPWVLRAYTDPEGRDCVKPGRLRDGVFGQFQRGRFRALPPSSPGATCAPIGASGPLLAVHRDESIELTVVFGLVVDRTPVTVSVGDQVQRVQPAGLGAFLALFEGADARSRVVVRSKIGGRTNIRRLD